MPALVSSQVFIPEPGRRYHYHTLSDGRVFGWWERGTPEGQPTLPTGDKTMVEVTFTWAQDMALQLDALDEDYKSLVRVQGRLFRGAVPKGGPRYAATREDWLGIAELCDSWTEIGAQWCGGKAISSSSAAGRILRAIQKADAKAAKETK